MSQPTNSKSYYFLKKYDLSF